MNKLFRMLTLVCVTLVAVMLTGCTKVEPGHVGIVVNQYGGSKGVQDLPLRTGMVFYNPITETVYEFPIYVQNVIWSKDPQRGRPIDDSISFNSIEGAVFNVDIALSYSFIAEKVPHIFTEFRADPDTISHGYLRNQISDSFNRHASRFKAVDIFGNDKQKILDDVKKDLNDHLLDKGFKFDLVSFTGGFRVDPRVQESINSVLEQTQMAIKAQAKVLQSKAEADQTIEKARGAKETAIAEAEGEARSITLKAKAQADANLILAQSITPQLIQYQSAKTWDGKLPLYNGGGIIPFINIGGHTNQ